MKLHVGCSTGGDHVEKRRKETDGQKPSKQELLNRLGARGTLQQPEFNDASASPDGEEGSWMSLSRSGGWVR